MSMQKELYGGEQPVIAKQVSCTDLGQLYFGLYHRLHRIVDEAMSQAGLSLSRAKVLMALGEGGPMKQASLACRLGFAARSVTDTVDGLERDGLAARAADPHDRRAWLVEITPAGEAALEKALAVRKKLMQQAFGSLNPHQRQEFTAILTALSTSLDTTFDTQTQKDESLVKLTK